ncbi:hypothetical protein C2S51_001708 [Perilla frutescens var. frutescens]|nr:hypothetical protein C2S51_001708 [Perilla frutescens var. frutescens]
MSGALCWSNSCKLGQRLVAQVERNVPGQRNGIGQNLTAYMLTEEKQAFSRLQGCKFSSPSCHFLLLEFWAKV